MARSTSIRQGLLRNLVLVIVLVGGGIIAVSVYAARYMLESLVREVIGDNLTVTEVELQRFFEPVAATLRTSASHPHHARPVARYYRAHVQLIRLGRCRHPVRTRSGAPEHEPGPRIHAS